MGIFGNLSTDGLEKSEDRVGGGNGWIRDTDIIDFTIKALYAGKSANSNAQSVTFIGVDSDGKEYRETFWITNGQGQNYFMAKDKDKKETGKKSPLPGFSIINDICMITTDKPLSDQDTAEKVFKIWDTDARQELPKSVPMLVDCIGKKVSLAIYRQQENKTVHDKASNTYVETADVRELNVTEKAFFTNFKATVREVEVAMENGGSVTDDAILDAQSNNVGIFWNAWIEAHKGKVKDKRKIKDGAGTTAGRPGSKNPPAQGASGGTERKSLFAKS